MQRLGIIVAVGSLAFHAVAARVWAQAPAQAPEEQSAWLKWVIAGGLAVVICASGFLNAKRSHLT